MNPPHPTHTDSFFYTLASSVTISYSLTPTLSVSSFPMFLTLSQSSLRGIRFFICCFPSLLSLSITSPLSFPHSGALSLISLPQLPFLVHPLAFPIQVLLVFLFFTSQVFVGLSLLTLMFTPG